MDENTLSLSPSEKIQSSLESGGILTPLMSTMLPWPPVVRLTFLMRTPSMGGMEIYISDSRTRPYISATGVTFNNSTTTAILTYQNTTTSPPFLPVMPSFNDTPTAFKFMSNLTCLMTSPFWHPVK
ncbi:hypothetical protein L1887_12751 [Cichorium endivia]|nr:hypothetical protein L1887_12751 [Cichorium endivia]